MVNTKGVESSPNIQCLVKDIFDSSEALDSLVYFMDITDLLECQALKILIPISSEEILIYLLVLLDFHQYAKFFIGTHHFITIWDLLKNSCIGQS